MLKFSASLDFLYDMLEPIMIQARLAGFDESQQKKIKLAAEEVLVNIIQHGYSCDEQGTIEILCEASFQQKIQIMITDFGVQHNPLLEMPAVKLEGDKVGGNGIRLLRGVMDEIIYERKGGNNVLKLVKYWR
jgi:serine/threonine-protein kinase RsbW